MHQNALPGLRLQRSPPTDLAPFKRAKRKEGKEEWSNGRKRGGAKEEVSGWRDMKKNTREINFAYGLALKNRFFLTPNRAVEKIREVASMCRPVETWLSRGRVLASVNAVVVGRSRATESYKS